MTNSINYFGPGIKGKTFNAELLGGKGAKLAEMCALGLPVPPGVTITTEVCNNYLTQSIDMDTLVDDVLNHFENIAHDFGYMPLVSVRSGARVSMPGMMDTILNVGLNDENIEEWAQRLGSEDAALDSYRRLIEMYANVVHGIPVEVFELADGEYKHSDVVAHYLEVYQALVGEYFPQAIEEQLAASIESVFKSWNSERAVAYRAVNGIPNDWGTAVNVQTMVFGNRCNNSCSGVMFTRDFNTGEPETVIDWIPNAQGEDVVNGSVTPNNKVDLIHWNQDVYDELGGIAAKLESYNRDMQDIEFTVEDGKLWILQTRSGKRAARAAFKIAWDMHMSGTISQAEVLERVSAKDYVALTAPAIDPSFKKKPHVEGIPAAGKIVTGVAVLSSEAAVASKVDCILVSDETTPDDFPGMNAAVGILTRNGGITSHAAVVARGMNKTCVVGAENLKFEGLAGKTITLDGETGRIWIDTDVPVIEGDVPAYAEEIVGWALDGNDALLLTAPESVSNGDSVYVDVSDRLSSVKTLKTALEACAGAEGIISFGNNTPVCENDSNFMSYFGLDAAADTSGDAWEVIAKVAKLKKWAKKFKNSFALHLPNDVDPAFVDMLREHGWNVVTRVNGFKAALRANGYVVIEDAFLATLKREDMDFAEIEGFIKKAGGSLKELPTPTTKIGLLFDALGG